MRKYVFLAGQMSRFLDLRCRLAFSRRRSLRWASTIQGLAMPYVRLYICINPKVNGQPTLSALHFIACAFLFAYFFFFFRFGQSPCMLHTTDGTSAQAVR
jgi:hypothetical protein